LAWGCSPQVEGDPLLGVAGAEPDAPVRGLAGVDAGIALGPDATKDAKQTFDTLPVPDGGPVVDAALVPDAGVPDTKPDAGKELPSEKACASAADCKPGQWCVVLAGGNACVTAVCTPAIEVCDGVDNDCDGTTDEASCADGDPCSTDLCNGAEKLCSHKPLLLGAACDLDGNACTGETCVNGSCTPGGNKSCSDGNPCTADACHPLTGACLFPPLSGAACNDGNACTEIDVCQSGMCKPGSPKSCDDGSACTVDACDANTGVCKPLPVLGGVQCTDGNACTKGDSCQSGVCQGLAVSCDDAQPCTFDTCSKTGGCLHTALTGSACSDGLPCTVGDTCQAGFCKPQTGVDCNDGNPCTTDTCTGAGQCGHQPFGGPCQDGSACTIGETCSGGVCAGGTALPCQDGNPCTADQCNPANGCTFVVLSGACNDGSPCTGGDTCVGGGCVGKALTCDDQVNCTVDSCDPSAGGCVHAAKVGLCNDNDPCTTDACLGSGCAHKVIPDCCGGKQCPTGEVCILYPDNLQPFCAKTCKTGNDCGGSCCHMTHGTKHCLTPLYKPQCCGTSEYWGTQANPYGCGVGGSGQCLGYPNQNPPYYPSKISHCDLPCTSNAQCPGSCCGSTTLDSNLCIWPAYATKFCPGQ